MTFPKSINLGLPLLIFIVLLFLVVTDVFYFKEVTPETTIDRILYLIIHISFWFSTAFLFNTIVNKFFWGGINKIPVGDLVLHKIKDFLSVLVYAIVVVLILANYFGIEPSYNLYAVALIATFIGTLLRPYSICYLRTVFLSNSSAFNIGDWIKLKAINSETELVGEVTDIDRKNLKLKTENNNIVTISQSSLADFAIENYWGSGKEARFEVNFIIDHSISPNRVKRILKSAAKQAIEEEFFLDSPEPEVIIREVVEYGVKYSIYFWIIPWEKIPPSNAIDKITSTVIEYLGRSGLTLSYPKEEIQLTKIVDSQTLGVQNNDIKKIISNVDLFDSLNEDELTDLATHIIEKEFISGDILIKQNEDGDSMFIVIEGLLDVFINSKDGHQIKVGRLTPGDFFGEMSLMTGDKRSATVIAATDVLVYEITKENISKIIDAREDVINEFGEIISRRSEVNIQFKKNFESSKQTFLNEIVGKIKKFFKR